MANVHAGHSTTSNGKLQSQRFIGSRIVNRGLTGALLTLVGSGEGLKRHVDWYRSLNFTGAIIVYERDEETYFELLRAKRRYYPEDANIIIRMGDLLGHDFSAEPIAFVDFDSCDSFGAVTRPEGVTFAALFANDVPCIALTFTSRSGRGHSNEELAHKVNSRGISQMEIALGVLHRLFPRYIFEPFSYLGVKGNGSRGGTPMFTVLGILSK